MTMTLRVTFDTAPYRRSHGKEPRGAGCWAFAHSPRDPATEAFFSPGEMTFTEAKRWFRGQLEQAGVLGRAVVYVLP